MRPCQAGNLSVQTSRSQARAKARAAEVCRELHSAHLRAWCCCLAVVRTVPAKAACSQGLLDLGKHTPKYTAGSDRDKQRGLLGATVGVQAKPLPRQHRDDMKALNTLGVHLAIHRVAFLAPSLIFEPSGRNGAARASRGPTRRRLYQNTLVDAGDRIRAH